MNTYHKINGVFKRDEKWKFIMWDWACPEFEYLQDYEWDWYEKVDGTNIRIWWDWEWVSYWWKTDNAQIPPHLEGELLKIFWLKKTIFREVFPDSKENPICLYWEWYWEKIQSWWDYWPASFILFDVKIWDVWLKREDVEDIAEKLGIKCVSKVWCTTLNEAIQITKGRWWMSLLKDWLAEWAIWIPKWNLLDRMWRRIIIKLKHKDLINQ